MYKKSFAYWWSGTAGSFIAALGWFWFSLSGWNLHFHYSFQVFERQLQKYQQRRIIETTEWVRGLNNIKQKSLLCIAFCRYRTYCDLCRTSTYIIKSAIHSHPILYGTGLAHPLQEWIRRWCHTPWQFLCVEALFYFSSSCIHIQWILPISLYEDAQVRFCIRIPYNWQSTA